MAFWNRKSELAIQSLLSHSEMRRLNGPSLVILASAFLTKCMQEQYRTVRDWLMDCDCYWTGQYLQNVTFPFSRVRTAPSWQRLTFPCCFVCQVAMIL
jgi:hypothetical protein